MNQTTDFALTILTGSDGVQTVNLRDVHHALGIGKHFTTWIQDRIESYGFVEGVDFTIVKAAPGTVPNSGRRGESDFQGNARLDYYGTLGMAKELAMLENNDLGRRVRRYFIRKEAEANARLPVPSALPMPTHRDALLGWVAALDRAEVAESRAAALQPAADFVEAVAESGDTRSPRRVAAFLKVKEPAFFELLRVHKWAYRDPGTKRWVACKERVLSGDLVMVLSVRELRSKTGKVERLLDDQGRPRTDETMHFTGQGFVRIQRLVPKWLAP